MTLSPKTLIIRHRKENLKKCSLRGLEKKPEFLFYQYPLHELPPLAEHGVLLCLEGEEELSSADSGANLILIDATWRYAQKMIRALQFPEKLKKRRLPKTILTAYPRKQEDCPEPGHGLASIEALTCAFALLGRPFEALLENYHWKMDFLEKNQTFFQQGCFR